MDRNTIFKSEDGTSQITLEELRKAAIEESADNEYDYAMRNPEDLLGDGYFEMDSAMESFLGDYDGYPDLSLENVKNNSELYDEITNALDIGNSEGFEDAQKDMEKIIHSKVSVQDIQDMEFDNPEDFFENWTDMGSDELYKILGLEDGQVYWDYGEDLDNATASKESQNNDEKERN